MIWMQVDLQLDAVIKPPQWAADAQVGKKIFQISSGRRNALNISTDWRVMNSKLWFIKKQTKDLNAWTSKSEKRFKFIAFILLVFFYPSRHTGEPGEWSIGIQLSCNY